MTKILVHSVIGMKKVTTTIFYCHYFWLFLYKIFQKEKKSSQYNDTISFDNTINDRGISEYSALSKRYGKLFKKMNKKIIEIIRINSIAFKIESIRSHTLMPTINSFKCIGKDGLPRIIFNGLYRLNEPSSEWQLKLSEEKKIREG